MTFLRQNPFKISLLGALLVALYNYAPVLFLVVAFLIVLGGISFSVRAFVKLIAERNGYDVEGLGKPRDD